MSEMLPAADLRRRLEKQGLAWTAPIEHFESLASTSDRLKERAREGAPEWTVVVADRQTAGRGRHGRSWLSPPGNAYASVLLRPNLPPERVPILSLAAGVAVAEAVGVFGVDAQLKWPNDVLAGGRKLAGILAEAFSGPSGLEAVVLGVGVNVGLGPADAPEDLRDSVTSIVAETGRWPDPAEVVAQVLARLTVWYHALGRSGAEHVVERWRALSVPWWGRSVEVRSGAERLRGVARGVDDRGALLLDLEDGSSAAIVSGEVKELRLR